MIYKEVLAYFRSLKRFGIMPGLERVGKLCEKLGNPQDELKCIHVAGTNGKGSTSTMLANIFTASGCKTGLYTSPYVLDFSERIRIDGVNISQSSICDIYTRVKKAADALNEDGITTTEFEILTAGAFLYFKESGCQVVVLEAGLGGRFDATNLIKAPLASVITSISLDHMAILGDTLEKIAFEKCGIIKDCRPVITSRNQPHEALAVIKKVAADFRSPLYIADIGNVAVIEESLSGSTVNFGKLKVKIPLIGTHMIENALLAVMTARELGISSKAIRTGIEKTVMTARMEVISDRPLIVRDGGHNEGGARALVQTIDRYFKGKKITAVCGMMSDKDFATYLSVAAPHFDRFIAVTPSYHRALDGAILARTAMKYCSSVMAASSPKDGYITAKKLSGRDDVIIVCGSFYLMSDIFNK